MEVRRAKRSGGGKDKRDGVASLLLYQVIDLEIAPAQLV